MCRNDSNYLPAVLLCTVGLVSLLTLQDLAEKPAVPKHDKVIFSCKGSGTLTYNYDINGTTLVDLDTGRVTSIYKCYPVNVPPG